MSQDLRAHREPHSEAKRPGIKFLHDHRCKPHRITLLRKNRGGGWQDPFPSCQDFSVALANELRNFLELIENRPNLVLDAESLIAIYYLHIAI